MGIWVVYDAGEKLPLTEVDGGDVNCADGKLYSTTVALTTAGDTLFNYRFFANDSVEDAMGEATTDHQVTVLNAVKVRGAGGAGWFSTIQSAIDDAGSSHVVVYDGTYNEGIVFDSTNDNNHTLQSACGADSTTINGSGFNKVVEFGYLSTGSEVDGFSITGGYHGVYFNSGVATIKNSKIYGNDADPARDISNTAGGGIYNTNPSTVTLENVDIYSNYADNGGGIYNSAGNFTITDSLIRNNTAINGGAFFIQSKTSGISITNTDFKDNVASGSGGGFYFNTGSATVKDCIISGNTSTSVGGAWYVNSTDSSPTFENCIVANNSGSLGGVFFLNSANTTLINSTLVGNSATSTGGGVMYVQNTSNAIIRNSILWDNTASNGYIGYFNGGVIDITDSIVSNDGDDVFTNAPYFAGSGTPNISGYTAESLPNFVDAAGGNYHIQQPSDAIDNASAAYAPAFDLDGISRPQGVADDIGAYEVVAAGSNTAPTLAWTGEADYESDSIDPAWGFSGSDFTFRIDFSDVNDTLPAAIQVWLDEDNNGAYSEAEKYAMAETDGDDSTTSDGKRYSLTKAISTPPSSYFMSYRLYANDGQYDATGAPIVPGLIALINNPPTMAYTGEANYGSDGVNPDSGDGGSDFTFRVDFTDVDDTIPTLVEVWIDNDDNGSYEAGEKYAMSETDAGDTATSDGKRYALTRSVPYVADGFVNYRFYATDGLDAATGGLPVTAVKTIAVTLPPNEQAVLSWSAGLCRDEGVRPPVGASYSDFEFLVNYSDADDHCPTAIEVWVDENDNTTYEAEEKYALTEVDGGDSVCSDGKLYQKTDLNLASTGDGIFNYRFYANDGIQEATGTPATTGGTIEVLDAYRVRPGGGVDWESSIDAAVDKTTGPLTTLVYPNADFSAATYNENVLPPYALHDKVIRSVCGPDLTIVSSTNTNSTFVFNGNNNPVVDGFTITGATADNQAGIYINGGTHTEVLFKNNKIHGNNHGLYLNDSNGAPVKIQNSVFYSNSVRAILAQADNVIEITDSLFYGQNTTAGGGVMYLNNTTSTTIKRSTFRDNISTGEGGVINLNGSKPLTVENSIFANNQGSNGGVFRIGGGTLTVTNSTFADNTATNGGVFYFCAAGVYNVRNSIFWANTASNLAHVAYKACSGAVPGFMTITDSNVDTSGNNFYNGPPTTSANIDPAVDPSFIDATADNYHIQPGSPMVDQANATYAPADDIEGEARPMGAADDIGADEAN
ncbi:MAG: right-handed parallel beta-helix repeat-containing protein [Candidatus Polarisedimenticolaceae bacterium]|nr:right-handed parallel beta-helix repeat-containing protein [Candidatus Polarisedimenticolaceae bacterium]